MKARRNLLVVRLVVWLTIISFLSSSISWAGVVDVQKLASQSLVGTRVPLSNALAEGQMLFEQLQIDTIGDRGEFYRRLSEADVGDIECFDSIDPDKPNERAYYVVNLEKRYFSRITTSVEVNDLFYRLVSGYWPSISSEVRMFKIGGKVFYQWLYSISDNEIEFIRSCIEKTINIGRNWVDIKDYLRQIKESVHAMVENQTLKRIVHIVMGSEACDLDSIVSSIAYAYAKAKKAPSDVLFVPVMNIPKEDFHLRTEAFHLLGEVGITEDDLLYRDTIDKLIHGRFKIQITLVDHNKLATEQNGLWQFVTKIIDHHKDEQQCPAGVEKEIVPVGSATTLVAERILLHMHELLDQSPSLSLLLLGTILLDTVNLNSKAGRVTERDSKVAEELSKLVRVNQNDLYERIKKAREDISSLSCTDLLRRDYKGYCSGSISYGVSSIFGISLKKFIEKEEGDLLEYLESIRKRYKLKVLFVMPSYYEGEVFKRELLIYTSDEHIMEQLVEFLSGDKDSIPPIQLGEINISSFVTASRIRAFTIACEISRKKLELLLDTFFSSKISDEKVQPFAPIGTEEIDYLDLINNFNNKYEVKLDLSKNKGKRFEAKDSSKPEAVRLAELLNTAIDNLESILGVSTELSKYWNKLLSRDDNRILPIKIGVNSKLPHNSVRYLNPVTNTVEIIFNEIFITTLLINCKDYPVVSYILGERILHELGHSPVKSFYQELRQEYELLKRDIDLHRLLSGDIQSEIDKFFNEVNPTSPSGRYFKLIQALINNPEIIESFDLLIDELEILEMEQDEMYRARINYTVGIYSRQERNERIERAFQIGDPDFGDSISNRIKKKGDIIKGTFLNVLYQILTHRAVACGRESFLFLAREPLSVIPFDQFKSPRVPGWIVSPDKEAGRWARQYYAIHKGRRFSDGIGITEAENGRGMQQRWHKHDTTQEFTISLCDDTQLRYGHELVKGTPTEMRDGKEYVTQGADKGKEVVTEGNLRIVVDGEKIAHFGSVICMPKNTYHTLKNISVIRPSIDFTVKDPVTQLIKTFSPPQEKLLENVEVRSIEGRQFPWGEQYTLVYPVNYSSKMLVDPETGEMLYQYDEKGDPLPVMYDPVGVTLHLFVVNNGGVTEKFPFIPFYDDMQVIRIFPWPMEIPEDEQKFSFRRKWILDRDAYKIEAEFIIYNEEGEEIDKRIVHGGDIVILHSSLGMGVRYSIRNISKNNYELMFFTLESEWGLVASFRDIIRLTQEKKKDVRDAGRRLLRDFIEKQDDSTLAMLLQRALDEGFGADELGEIVRAFVSLPDGKGLDRFHGLQQKFMVYSAPPGTGKDEVMKATFEGKPEGGIKGKYQDIIGKLILYHTRDPRVKKGVCEKDGVAYHFRTKEKHEELNQEGSIDLGSVNRQEQGLVYNSFSEKGVAIKNVFRADKLKVGDQIINYSMVTGVVTVKRNGELIEIQDVYIPLDKPGIFLPDDVVENISGDIVVVTRKIKGMDSVFDGQLPVILEGGYDWFRKLGVKFFDILSVFISLFSDGEIEIRARNTEWIREQFETVEEKVLAYSEMARLIADVKKGEIDLEDEPELKRMIVDFVNKGGKGAINPIELANVRLIESPGFIEDLDKLLRDFGKEPILPEEESMVRAMAYEVNRRTASRDGLVRFSRMEDTSRYTSAGVDPQYDRYNRVLEGVVQIRHRNEYDYVVVNPWGYTPEVAKASIAGLTEQFSRLFFVSLIKGMIDSLKSELAVEVNLKSIEDAKVVEQGMDINFSREGLWVLDAIGNIIGNKNRASVHQEGDWHAATWILAFDERGNILLQKRSSNKKAYPGCWEFSASGHVSYGMSYRETAVNELREELGMDIDPGRLTVFGNDGGFIQNREIPDNYRIPGTERIIEKERLTLYLLVFTDSEFRQIKPNPEVTTTRLVTLDQLREEMEENPAGFTLTLQDILLSKKYFKAIKEALARIIPKRRLPEDTDKLKASQYSRIVDESSKEIVLYEATLDTMGNILGEELKEDSRQNEKFNRFFNRVKLTAMLERVKTIHDVGIFGAAKRVVIVDNLGGLDSFLKDEKGALAVYQDGRILIDIDAFRNGRVLMDVLEHELWESILELVESNPGVRETTAIYQNLKAFVDMPEIEQMALIEFLNQPESGLDSQGYAELLQHVVDNRITGDGLISLAVGYVLRESRYSYLRKSIAEALGVTDAQRALQEILSVSFDSTEVLASSIKKACEKLNLATEIYSDLIKVTTEWKPVINKVKSAELKSKAIMKIKMIVSRLLVVELGLEDVLLQNNKYIRLDRDELQKPENKYIKDWINKITKGKEKSPIIFSDEDVPEGVKIEDVIYLIEPDRINSQLPQDRLYLPLPYSITSIYLASQVVLAGGKASGIQDKLALNTIKALYETLLGMDVSESELEELFRTPWTVLLPITQISAVLDTLRKAIGEIEKAA